jgi:radical SAM protein with 4Fe4S-binding SPASM domain
LGTNSRKKEITTTNPLRKLQHVDIELTKKCNLDCVHCSARASKNVRNDELSVDEIERLLGEAKSLGLESVGLTGGEPFFHRDKLMKVLDFCHYDLKVPVHVHTNGILIDCKDMEKISAIVSEITVALYGSNPRTHDSITQVEGSMKSTWRSLDGLIRARANVSVYTVPMKCNMHEIVPLIKKASAKGVKRIRILSLSPTGRAKGKFDEMNLNSDEVKWLNREMNVAQEMIDSELCAGFCTSQFYPELRMLPGHDSCLAGENRMHIDAFGTVFPCTASSGTVMFAAGNLRDEDCTLSELWKQSPLFQFIRKFHSNPPEKCQKCRTYRSCMSGCRVMMAYKYGDVTIANPECKGPIYETKS